MIVRRRAYSADEVYSLMKSCEGRPSPFGPWAEAHGHSRHIDISSDALRERAADRVSDQDRRMARRGVRGGYVLALTTAWCDSRDAARAVSLVLGSTAGQAALGHLDTTVRSRVLLEAAFAPPSMLRYSSHPDIVRKAPAVAAFVILDRTESGPGIFLHTHYPLFALSSGEDSWRPAT